MHVHVNQLANSAVYSKLMSTHTTKREGKSDLTIKLRRLLKTGIASAMIQAIVHKTSPISTHDPIDRQLRFCMWSVPRKIRT